MRFVLLDRITSLVPGQRGTACKHITLSEDFFEDHFPRMPIMPGVLILEGLAQLSGLVLEEGMRAAHGRRVKALMSIVEKAKFRAPARPGDCLAYSAEVESVNDAGGSVRARAERDGVCIAECRLIFSFHEFDDPQLQVRQDAIVAVLMAERPADGAR